MNCQTDLQIGAMANSLEFRRFCISDNLYRRFYCIIGKIGMLDRSVEKRQQTVTKEFVDDTAIIHDDFGQPGKVGIEKLYHRMRVVLLTEGREAADIGDQYAQPPAFSLQKIDHSRRESL